MNFEFNLPAFSHHRHLLVRLMILLHLVHVSLDLQQLVRMIPHYRYHLPNQIVEGEERVALY